MRCFQIYDADINVAPRRTCTFIPSRALRWPKTVGHEKPDSDTISRHRPHMRRWASHTRHRLLHMSFSLRPRALTTCTRLSRLFSIHTMVHGLIIIPSHRSTRNRMESQLLLPIVMKSWTVLYPRHPLRTRDHPACSSIPLLGHHSLRPITTGAVAAAYNYCVYHVLGLSLHCLSIWVSLRYESNFPVLFCIPALPNLIVYHTHHASIVRHLDLFIRYTRIVIRS